MYRSLPTSFIATIATILLAMIVTSNVRGQRPRPFPSDLELIRDIKFGTGGERPLTMHIVRPRKPASDKLPVFVWIHGGGWQSGNHEQGIGRLIQMAREGFVSASIEYRLSGEASFPAQIHDCKCAIRYLRAHAEKYGLSPNQIAVGGASAGGHLAALLGTSGGVMKLEGTGGWPDQSSRVQAVYDLFGPTDLTRFVTTPGYRKHALPDSPESRLIGGPVLENKAAATAANPIHYVSKDDPPFLIYHGSLDPTVPPNQSQLLHAALIRTGVPSTLHIIENARHGGPEFATPEVQRITLAFLRKSLK